MPLHLLVYDNNAGCCLYGYFFTVLLWELCTTSYCMQTLGASLGKPHTPVF